MKVEYLKDAEIISWGTVFAYDTRDNLFAGSGLESWTTFPFTDFNYGLGSNDLGFVSPINGAAAVILDIDVADESEYTASNVIVKFRSQAGGSITSLPTGEIIRSGEIEGINLRGFERSPSSKQTQVIVPLNSNGTFDYSYEVSGELPLLRHIKIVGKMSEFDVESLRQGTKISQLPFTDTQIDDMFIVSRCEDEPTSRKFIKSEGGGNSIPDFSENTRDYNASYAVSLYHLKQGLGVGAHCTIIVNDKGEIDEAESCMINCFVEKDATDIGRFIITTTNGLYKDKQVTVLASSSSGSSQAVREGGFIAVDPPTFSLDNSIKVLPPIAGQAQAERAFNAEVIITQYNLGSKRVMVDTPRADDRKDANQMFIETVGGPEDNTQYCPYALYISFIGK